MMKEGDAKIHLDADLAAERDYWLSRLSGAKDVAYLRADYPPAPGRLHRLEVVEASLTGVLYGKLLKLTSNQPLLLYSALMTGLKICLYKYTGNNVVVVGSPTRQEADGRQQPANLLAIADEINGQMSFRELLLNVRQTV